MKILIAILVTTLGLQLQAAPTLEADYQKALTAYKSKDFTTSYEILSKLYLSRLSDASLSYQLGRSAYETGHYSTALAAFERVEMLDGGNIKNKLEMARTYFMLKMYEESESAFKEVLQNQSIPDNVRTNIELYLARSSKVQQKSFTYATLGVDFVYDSNINFGSLNSSYQVGGNILPSEDERDGGAYQVYGDITNIYDIGDKNGFAIKNKLSIYGKKHSNSDNDDYDIGYLLYNPSLLYKETKYTAELELGIDTLSLGESSYMQTMSISPKIEWNHTPTVKSLAYFKYADKDYNNNRDRDLDANHYELSYALQNILTPRSYIQAKVIGMMERRHHGNRVDVEFDEYKIDINYANQFNATYGLELFGEWRERNYQDSSLLFNNSKREDDGGTVSATLNIEIMKTFDFRLKYLYNKVYSNQGIYSYDKNSVTAGFVKTF